MLGFLQLFSGGALTQFAVFALGIMPYITARSSCRSSRVVIPKLEQWQNQGAVGQRKITQWTRYLTIAHRAPAVHRPRVPVPQRRRRRSVGAATRPTSTCCPTSRVPRVLLVVLTLTAGTALLMWMGELITQRGIGNGMSLLIFASVGQHAARRSAARSRPSGGNGVLIVLIAVFIVILVAIVFVEQGQRRIPVQFAKRVVGRRMYGGQSTYIPLKVNQAGVIPIIFASSVLYLPQLLVERAARPTGWGDVRAELRQRQPRASPTRSCYIARLRPADHRLRVLLHGDHVRPAPSRPTPSASRAGSSPASGPGPQTERYLAKILTRITLPGALFIAVIALLPVDRCSPIANVQSFPFAGTSILIAVGVALETMKQIDSQLMMRNYEGFLK